MPKPQKTVKLQIALYETDYRRYLKIARASLPEKTTKPIINRLAFSHFLETNGEKPLTPMIRGGRRERKDDGSK